MKKNLEHWIVRFFPNLDKHDSICQMDLEKKSSLDWLYYVDYMILGKRPINASCALSFRFVK